MLTRRKMTVELNWVTARLKEVSVVKSLVSTSTVFVGHNYLSLIFYVRNTKRTTGRSSVYKNRGMDDYNRDCLSFSFGGSVSFRANNYLDG